MLDRKDLDDLASLRYHWDGAYRFTMSADTWIATSMSCPAVALTATSADELRLKVRADYAGRAPVPNCAEPHLDHGSEQSPTSDRRLG